MNRNSSISIFPAALAAAAVALTLNARAFAAPTGLDALDDEKLFNELAGRNLTTLLDRAFELDKTPEPQRQAIRGRITLLRLKDNPNVDLLVARRAVAAYVEALPQILPTLNDPAALIGDANLLIDNGVASDQSILEYFGPSPGATSRLRPAAAAARELLARAEAKADAICKTAMDHWPAMEKTWDAADGQKTIAAYTRAILAYPQALATDKADPKRDKLLTDAIAALEPFDTDDNPDRASVKFYVAKLNLARGTPESLNVAADGFAYAIAKGQATDVRQQFDSRLLTAGVRLAQDRLDGVDAAVGDLQQWAQSAGLDARQVEVAVAGIRFREAMAANKPDEADGVMDTLLQKHPELRGLVLELIAARTEDAAPAAALKSLGLQARLARAETETLRPAGQPFDRAAVERGIDAAREILHRRELPADRLNDTAFVLGYYLQKLDKNPEAAAAFLDYVETFKTAGTADRLNTAMDQAIALVGVLMKSTPDDPAVTKLYDRTLAAAVAPPLNRAEFAYEYARRVQAAGKSEAAVAAFRQVPANDRNYGESRYYLMVALRQQLDAMKADDPQRPAVLKELSGLTDTVSQTTAERLKNPATPDAGARDRVRLAQTKLFAADLALREQKDAARAVQLLENFESSAAGLPNENDLLSEVLLIRVQAFVQLGDLNKATDQLNALVQRNPAAGQVVYDLLKKLDEQITTAEAAGRTDEAARLERDRAVLTPHLVDWSANNPNPRIQKLTYTYRVFDADTQRRAAELTPDAAERKRLLGLALERFQKLDDADSVAAYLASLPPDKRAAAKYDPQVKLGLARTDFALEDWTSARLQLATLFSDKVLGSGYTTVTDAAGNFQSRENASYWEALLRLIQCNLKLHQNEDAMKNLLREQSLIYGDGLGGKRWGAAFNELLKQLALPAATQASVPSPGTPGEG